jgi:hypothetical protein
MWSAIIASSRVRVKPAELVQARVYNLETFTGNRTLSFNSTPTNGNTILVFAVCLASRTFTMAGFDEIEEISSGTPMKLFKNTISGNSFVINNSGSNANFRIAILEVKNLNQILTIDSNQLGGVTSITSTSVNPVTNSIVLAFVAASGGTSNYVSLTNSFTRYASANQMNIFSRLFSAPDTGITTTITHSVSTTLTQTTLLIR